MTELDSDVKLPKQIQDEADRAEQIEREIEAMLNPPAEAAPESEETDLQVPEGETPPTAEAPAEPAPEAPSEETWQARYNALQGKYNAEVPRYAAQLREANQYIQQLQEQLNKAPAEPQADLDAEYKEAADLFGEDLVKFTRKMAQAEADRRIAELKQSQQQVEQRIAQSENDRFFAQVDAAVPGWRDIDNDPAWLGWLQEYDPLLGAPRQAALEQAAATHDVNRVSHLFTAFLSTRRQPAAPAAPQPSRAQLEQVTPRSGAVPTAPTPQARIYTQADIQRLLDPRYLNRLPRDQQVAIERDIDQAAAEGRIAA